MKRILFFAVLIASFFIIKGLLTSIYTLWQKQGLVEKAYLKLEKERKENERLKKELERAQTLEFIEEEARNKLLMIKEGEEKIMISKELLASQSALNKKIQNKPNWQKWLELFF